MTKKYISQKEIDELTELRRRRDLPHLYGWKWYEWAWKFYQSVNRFNFLCAANQISKSSTQIRKAIHWATEKSLWPKLWRNMPTQFWYLYPTKPVCTTEFYEKWVPEFLPKGAMKNDSVYGWKEEIKNKEIWAIHFNSGVSIYFKTYEQDTQNLQTGTCYAIFCDEECPEEHLQELRSRLNATNGFFHMCFTATLGQEIWRRTIEPRNEDEELFRGALKLQVSMYDCLKYRDGSDSFWTLERIKEIELECATEAEVQKRVYGKFILSGGLKCSGFSRTKNIIKRMPIPDNWPIYTGVDPGTGGESNHPAAIAMVAVRPDYKLGIVFKGWRGDGVDTASNDILEKHTELCTYEVLGKNLETTKKQHMPVLNSYDWQARDFFLVASKAGKSFTPADKARDRGTQMLNTLFKLGMLVIFDEDPELNKLINEITSLKEETSKSRAKDDFYDSLRYAVMPIPWDFDGVAGEVLAEEIIEKDERSQEQINFDERRTGRTDREETFGIEEELEEWGALYES